MRIGIDCLRVDPTYVGGLNTYVFGLLDGLAAVGGSDDFRVYVTSANCHLFAKYREQFELEVIADRSFPVRRLLCRATLLAGSQQFHNLSSDLLMRRIREKMDAESDVIYTPTVALLFFDHCKPTLLSMHDIQHLHYPEFFSWPRRLSRRITYGLSAFHADYFQASSDFIKRDMLAHFPQISEDRIAVIPEGVNIQDFSIRRDSSKLFNSYQLDERFLFLPAQLWPHKNHLRVLRALKRIEERSGIRIPLILTGAGYSAASDVLRFVAEQSMSYVRYLGRVPFGDLVGLYQSASFLISPGLYESNSLPVLEAAAAGTPIIASAIPPNQELASTMHLNLFDPYNEDELSHLIFRLWQDNEIGARQAAHNRAAVCQYSWENAALKYLELFSRIASSAA